MVMFPSQVSSGGPGKWAKDGPWDTRALYGHLSQGEEHKCPQPCRDLWRLSSPTPLFKVESVQQVNQDCVQLGLNIIKDGNSMTSLGRFSQHSTTLLIFKWNLLC